MRQVHDGPVMDVVNSIEIVDCADCNFKHALIFEYSFKSAGALDIMRNLYDSLASIGMGRELVIYAKKNA